MSNFKDKLSKHEELINKYKELYMNENSKSVNESSSNRNNISNNTSPVNNITNNNLSNNSYNKLNNTDIERSIEFNSENNHIGMSEFSSNKKSNFNFGNKDINVEQSLERINNLLLQLNSKMKIQIKK